ncbi:hypothetical protein DZG01_00645 [Pseudomonas fluorescens]|nr:hypothetical protein DZG01_00645 [Pseudomonas fluorescens]
MVTFNPELSPHFSGFLFAWRLRFSVLGQVLESLWERACSRRRPDSRPGSPGRTPIPLWERACSRLRCASQHQVG